MKALLVLLMVIGQCLLAPIASAQAYAQLDRQLDEDFRNRSTNGSRVQNDLLPSRGDEQQTAISMREASDIARGSYSGRVLSIRLDGRRWRVRMDEEGTVFNVFVDAESGLVSRPSE